MSAVVAEASATLGAQIDAIYALKLKKKQHEDEAVSLGKLIEAKEIILFAELEEQKIAGAKGKSASASIRESVVPQVEDWDEFYKYIHRNKAYELFERRVHAGAWREHAERRREKTVPGTVPYTKRKVQITKA